MRPIGPYPEVSLAEAHLKTLEFQKELTNGADPSSYQQEELLKAIQTNTGTFSLVAAEFLESKTGQQSEERFTCRNSYYKRYLSYYWK
ncbi:integrase [Acinetobacter baumannii]|uniref:Uncharacterized protein n=1 Tax=Acinetobacter baumannii TaxID=470 RepID=A0A1J0YYE3_ACIBA|nr:hypothetical protein [Acinetobacter baumannii]EXA92434.1 hypothetical protein J527_2664 [Acinetobacter baumannii 1267820]EXC67881.1 hypothetical protein J463_3374 [Acinetobacter baumannii 1043794]EXE92371.1 hypothetical protein J593_3263 [Acinetobacter baumannii 232184]EXF06445.1 hypothetical protein J600_3328 [Acinetobacter baumannii 268680]EXG95928.1 hypothetical protein J649_3158 [Acinetobacter baumannii 1064293_45]EYT15433.1 hypothetical protein J592_02834 [Acinetobacter baumannii 6553